jgi:hypothetical protein
MGRRTKQILGFAMFVMTSFALSACGNPFGGSQSSVQTGHDPGITPPPAPYQVPTAAGSELVSSSIQMKPSLGNRFLVQGTLASPTSQVMQTTTPRGYMVFSNVQGEFVSSQTGF